MPVLIVDSGTGNDPAPLNFPNDREDFKALKIKEKSREPKPIRLIKGRPSRGSIPKHWLKKLEQLPEEK